MLYRCARLVPLLVLLSSCAKKEKSHVVPVHDSAASIFSDAITIDQVCQDQHHKQTWFAHSRERRPDELNELVRQQEAKCADIPVPYLVDPILEYFASPLTADGHTLGYQSSMSVDEIAHFYAREMERLGWEHIASSNGVECLMSYRKPQRLCSISLRPCKKKKQADRVSIIIVEQQTV